jgi:hypothetical protein
MSDDDFSGLVRSGTQHSVSVSEHTGNAKTPKNVVVSHEEETEARKRAFEQKALAALEAERALAAALDEHTDNKVSDEAHADTNIQKVAADKQAANRQSLPGEEASKPNVQSVSTDAIEANRQKVGTDKIQDNIQSLGHDKGIGANVQGVSTEAIDANRQSIPTEGISANLQNVGNGNIAANNQNLAGEAAIQTNRQGVPTDSMSANVQDIPVGHISANVQDIHSDTLPPNQQTIEQDSTGINRQGIGNGPAASANLQALPQDEAGVNRQSLEGHDQSKNQQGIPTNSTDTNEQKLAKLGGQNNQQTIEENSFGANRQALAATPGLTPNHQAIGTDAPTLNRQAAPQDAPPSTNRQGVDNGKIESHFETLPSGEVVRKKVDFAAEAANVKTGSKPASRTNVRPRPPLTATEQQAAKLKREKMMDEFHGRVAGIKHNVDALNDRLTDFEEKVQKEDVNLIKGNPEDFDIDLD